MPERDTETSQFLPEVPGAPAVKLQHPALRPPKKKAKQNKQRRTIVRTIKLVNATDESRPQLIEVPIEPGHNNRGTLKDPTLPIRHYLEKGFILPHEFDGVVLGDGKPINLQVIFCAVSGCWTKATVTDDPEDGTERCREHNVMYDKGEIRYAMSGKGDV
jgi:hypothetical protein